MTPLVWPDWLENIWAKSPQDDKPGSKGESLPQHTWNVLCRLAEMIRLRPQLPETLGFHGLWNCLFWACFMHDFGKAAQGFQNRLRGGGKWPHRHEVLSLAFLDWFEGSLSQEEQTWVAAAIVSHHRDSRDLEMSYLDPPTPEEDSLIPRVAEISDITLDGLWRWLKECSQSWLEALGLANAGISLPELPTRVEAVGSVQQEGALRARHWLKAYRRFVRSLNRSGERVLITGTLILRGHLILSDHMASAHTGVLPPSVLERPSELMQRLGLEKEALYAHQRQCGRIRGSAVLVAPTGSGKTESALLWACSQSAIRPVPRLFYTLPYQASMNAMYQRLGMLFPERVGLEHSRSVLALYRYFLDQDYTPENAARSARWGKTLARLNYFPVRVLSPYQILKAAYRLKGYEALLSDFFSGAFVLDEVHAYDTGRLAMILGMMGYMVRHLDARFFIMSATLPSLLRTRLAEALGEHEFVQATPQLFTEFRRHELHLMEGDLLSSPVMAFIAEAVRDGQAVLVCVNTVPRAQEVYEELQERLKGSGVEVVLLHGRFNGRDRLGKEHGVRQATGSRSTSRQPIVLIATQVVEVSLDIDLDVIYTDPAPLEALFQRFGRINRRRRKARAPVYVFMEPEDGQGIYEAELVQAGLRVLTKNDGLMIDEEKISEWLDEVYQGEIARQWNEKYERQYADFCEATLASLRAFNADEGLEQEFYRAFDGIEVLPASLEAEYQRVANDDPLKASELLVPIRWRQFAVLRAKGKVSAPEIGWPKLVDAKYDEDLGLML